MFEGLASLARSGLEPLLGFYRDTNFAYTIAGVMAFVALVLVVIAVAVHLARMGALQARIMAIRSFITFDSMQQKSGVDSAEVTFASRFADVDRQLKVSGFFGASLAHAWGRYRRTLSFVQAPPIRSSQRPNSFLYAAVPPPTWLGFAANMFVAFGLLATFLGLVAALSFASEGMQSSEPEAMQIAIRDLLGAAASKFVTSVMGVGLSIVLRLLERGLTASLRNRVDTLSSVLEFGIRVDNEARTAAVAEQLAQLLDRLDLARPGSAAADPS